MNEPAGVRLRVPAAINGAGQAGVRPEKLSLLGADATPPDGLANVLSGQISVASFLGTAIQYVITTPGGEELTVVEQNRSHEPVGAGRQVKVAWRPEDTFVVAN